MATTAKNKALAERIKKQAKILELYGSGQKTLAQACKAAKTDFTTHIAWKKTYPEYAAAVALAVEHRVQVLEDEAYRRAVVGTEKPVFYLGQECGVIREFSDTCLIFMLKAANPERYRERWIQTPVPADVADANTLRGVVVVVPSQDGDDTGEPPN